MEIDGLRCLFDSPATACKQIKSFRGHGALALTARAHSLRKADTARWYIVPSNDWPAYGCGRYFAEWDPREEGAMRLGAILEKGLAVTAGPLLTKPAAKALVMQRNWQWREIVLADDSSRFIEAIVTAAANVRQEVLLGIEARRMDEAVGGDPYEEAYPLQQLLLGVNSAGGVKRHGKAGIEGDLARLAEAQSIDDVAAALRSLSLDEWLYLTVMPGLRIMLATEDGRVRRKKAVEQKLVTTHQLWETLLAPFEDWLG